jgi:hypothetical protein
MKSILLGLSLLVSLTACGTGGGVIPKNFEVPTAEVKEAEVALEECPARPRLDAELAGYVQLPTGAAQNAAIADVEEFLGKQERKPNTARIALAIMNGAANPFEGYAQSCNDRLGM